MIEQARSRLEELRHEYEVGQRRLQELMAQEVSIRETLLRFGEKLELTEIADRLGLSRKTLWEKKKKWGL